MSTVVWEGGAPAVAEVQTIAVNGTWANADTASITINGKAVTYTVSGLTGNTQFYTNAKLVAALNASTLAEFEEQTFANTSNTVMTITADTAGRPFTLATSEVTAGSGELGDPAVTTAASGPYVFNTAANWDSGAVPVAGDTVVFEYSDVDCLYNLDQSSVNNFASLTARQSYTGKIGLPRTNKSGGSSASDYYVEYREAYLKAAVQAVTIGEGTGSGSGRIKLSLENSATCAILIYDTGTPAESGVQSVVITNTHTDTTATISKGSVGFDVFSGETGTIATLKLGYTTNRYGDVTGRTGSGTTITVLDKSGGDYEIGTAATTITHTGGTLTIKDGSITTLNVDGGTVRYQGNDTITTVNGGGGTLDLATDMRARTFTGTNVYKGFTLLDPFKTVTFTNGIDLVRCGLSDVTLDLGDHQTLTPSAI